MLLVRREFLQRSHQSIRQASSTASNIFRINIGAKPLFTTKVETAAKPKIKNGFT
jgi:hypothetical protein